MSRSINEKNVTFIVDLNSTFERIETFIKYTTDVDPFWVHVFYAYALLVVLSFGISCYYDGVKGLMTYRTEQRERALHVTTNEEIAYVKQVVAVKVHGNFGEALWCPYTWISNVLPRIIVYMNPEEPPPGEDEEDADVCDEKSAREGRDKDKEVRGGKDKDEEDEENDDGEEESDGGEE